MSAAQSYFAATRNQRDMLLATARIEDNNPTVADIQREVTEIRDSRPTNKTAYSVRDTLVSWGWLEKIQQDGRDHYAVTDEGKAKLNDAAQMFEVQE